MDNSAYGTGLVERFLAASKRNQVVRTDFASIEAYRGANLQSLFEQTALLAQFPGQVVVLKSTGKVCGLRGRPAGLTRRMIDEDQTAGFESFCRDVAKARAGDSHYLRQLELLADVAKGQALEWLGPASRIASNIDQMTKGFSIGELKAIRTGKYIADSVRDKLFSIAIGLCALLLARHPMAKRNMPISEVGNTLPLRASVMMIALVYDWLAVGRTQRSPELTRNDLIDICVVAYATFFDGLITADARQAELYLLLPRLIR